MSNKLKEQIKKQYNTLSPFIIKLNVLAYDIVYGKGSISEAQAEAATAAATKANKDNPKGLKNLLKDPSLYKTLNGIRKVNTFDLCNPLNFVANKIIPPESEIGGKLNDAVTFIKELQTKLSGFSIIPGSEQVTATPFIEDNNPNASPNPNIPFIGQGKINLTFSRPVNKKLANGTPVILTQTNNPKVNSEMVGTIERIIPPPTNTLQRTAFNQGIGETTSYQINITSLTPLEPPYQTTRTGTTIVDENGDAILATYTDWTVQIDKKSTADIRELAKEVNSISTLLREAGIGDFANELADIRNVPGLSGLAKFATQITDIVNSPVAALNQGGVQTGAIANELDSQVAFLEGGLTAEQVLERSKLFREFSRKLEPLLAFDFSLESIFKSVTEDANLLVRKAIPYKELAQVIRGISKAIEFIIGIISFIILILKVLNTIVKIFIIILKVLIIVIKVLRKIIKILSIFAGGFGVILGNKLAEIQIALTQLKDALQKVSTLLEAVIAPLSLVKKYLKKIVRELGILAVKLESCESASKELKDSILNATKIAALAARGFDTVVPGDTRDYDVSIASGVIFSDQDGQRLRNELNYYEDEKFTATPNGFLLSLRDNVIGFDEFGNLVLFTPLISLASGVNFEESEGQALRETLNYYTFNKFINNPIINELLDAADKQAQENIKEAREVDPNDVFGNFQEKFKGYTLKIQEERTLPNPPNNQTATRRRGLALDNKEKIVASTELTFSTNLTTIVQELKFIILRNIELGILSINPTDSLGSIDVPDSDTLDMVQSLGASPILVNEIKSEANNRAASNISSVPDPTAQSPVETRIGNEPFTLQEAPPQAPPQTADKSSPSKVVPIEGLMNKGVNDFIKDNPSINNIQKTMDMLFRATPEQLNSIMNNPGSEELNIDEFAAKLKSSILDEIDPNPDKVEEITKKTTQWKEGLKEKTKADWEILFRRTRNTKNPTPPFELYYLSIEEQELPTWIRFLLRQRYTELEVQGGIKDEDLGDKYKIKINDNEVKVELRPARGK
tara:strand:+ start:6019 stop:9099 length:3081 start_codon:yes stop_codon:yes gene_type:complete